MNCRARGVRSFACTIMWESRSFSSFRGARCSRRGRHREAPEPSATDTFSLCIYFCVRVKCVEERYSHRRRRASLVVSEEARYRAHAAPAGIHSGVCVRAHIPEDYAAKSVKIRESHRRLYCDERSGRKLISVPVSKLPVKLMHADCCDTSVN